jgi:excisionase family DNA binding protein
MNDSKEILLSVSEVAGRLNVSTACIRRWILRRQIGVVKLGRLVRVSSSEIDRLIDSGSRPARPTR